VWPSSTAHGWHCALMANVAGTTLVPFKLSEQLPRFFPPSVFFFFGDEGITLPKNIVTPLQDSLPR